MSDTPSRGRVNRLLGQYIIKNEFQFRYGIYMFLFTALTGILMWLEAMVIVSNMLESGMVVGDDAIEQIKLISSIIGKTAILLSGVGFGVALLLTHYIAGPVYRLERLFLEMRDGKIGLFARLRTHDEFHETADAFNQGLSSLRSKLQKEREAAVKLVDEFSEKLGPADAAQMKKMMIEIQSNPQHIQAQLPK